jgi:hypothetical protein
MFISIRKYRVSGTAKELAQQVSDGFVPILKQISGFRGYYFLDCGSHVVVTISMFDSEQAALESIERSRIWVQENVAQYLSEPPEIVTGVTVIDIARP